MKTTIIHLLAATALGLALSNNASALPLSHAGYTLDESTNIVTGGGLEWLQWVETDGMTINEALTTHQSNGWRVASNVEMAGLFNAFGFGGIVWDTDENTDQFKNGTFDAAEPDTDVERIFVGLFGNTWTEFSYNTGDNDVEWAGALFGHDLDGDNYYNTANVVDDYTWTFFWVSSAGDGASIRHDISHISNREQRYGVALVRDSGGTQVPAPASFALLGLGLLAMVAVRRRTRSPEIQM